MSDLGGAMGMCLGASFITAMEFVELFTDLGVLFLAKCAGSNKNNKATKFKSNSVNSIGVKQ